MSHEELIEFHGALYDIACKCNYTLKELGI